MATDLGSNIRELPAKAPGEAKAYTFDWSDELAADDTISSSNWTVDTGIVEDSKSNTNTTAAILISGGAAGKSYAIKNTIVTTPGAETLERSGILAVKRL